jgi:hypothetical protein
LRAGALPGLQILCTAQKAVGGFNSHPLPQNKAFSALSNPAQFAFPLSAQDFCSHLTVLTRKSRENNRVLGSGLCCSELSDWDGKLGCVTMQSDGEIRNGGETSNGDGIRHEKRSRRC